MTRMINLLAAITATVGLTAACSSAPRPGDAITEYSGSGTVVEYHANGKVRRKAEYVDGRLSTVASYYASGQQESSERYEHGELESATYYFASGRVKARVDGD